MSTSLSNTAFSLPSRDLVGKFVLRWWWLAAAFALVYGQILPSLALEWWMNEDYTHGLFTPVAIAYLVYERRRELFSIPVAPSGFGFPIILLSQLLLTVGFLGAEFFLQRVSMLVFFAGMILFSLGLARAF